MCTKNRERVVRSHVTHLVYDMVALKGRYVNFTVLSMSYKKASDRKKSVPLTIPDYRESVGDKALDVELRRHPLPRSGRADAGS